MKMKWVASAMMLALSATATAGGLLTNTNQNIVFCRNFAREGAIGIDGVYSNPAGVALLDTGFHLSLNLQSARQTRTVTSTFGPFNLGVENGDNSTKKYEGEANAPLVPSLQLAYNTGKWSFQFGFAVTGGGGKCTFDEGLGSFESNVALLPMLLKDKMGITGYDVDCYMRGRQYYYGFTGGAAYRINDNLSVYGGLRMLYARANYYGYMKNIRVKTSDGTMQNANTYFSSLSTQAAEAAGKAAEAAILYTNAGDETNAAKYTALADEYKAQATQLVGLAYATQDVSLNCDEDGWGVAPIIGVDYKLGNLNLGAKYEFKTSMRLTNVSANSASADNLAQLSRFKDGNKVAEDSPALLTFGGQYEFTPKFRAMLGYHLYFDKDATAYGYRQKLLGGNTMEYLAGMEWDITKRIQASIGGQRTQYDLTDAYMNDMTFNVSSYALGFGAGVKITKRMKLNLSYFQCFYDEYDKETNDYNNLSSLVSQLAGQETANALVTSGQLKGSDHFTRTNYAFGLGLDIDF